MKLIITDTPPETLRVNGEAEIIWGKEEEIRCCAGCFGCWVKTPGRCVICDGYEKTGGSMSRCSELILVSRCVYGSVSPFVKAVLDRSISYLHPNFVNRNGQMHHKRRYENRFTLSAYFYGRDISQKEKETAQKLLRANAVNYDCAVGKLVFLSEASELGGVVL